MKLKEFLNNLNEFVKDNPKALDYEVIYSADEEGNGYNMIWFEPSDGVYNEEDKEFYSRGNLLEEPEEYEYTEKDCNAVCIN